jgi:hypothetical protein
MAAVFKNYFVTANGELFLSVREDFFVSASSSSVSSYSLVYFFFSSFHVSSPVPLSPCISLHFYYSVFLKAILFFFFLSRSRFCHYSVGGTWWHLCFYESF